LRYKITTKQQPKRCRMIVEDHDMSDRLAIYGYKSRPDREASLFSSRGGIPQPVGSNHHHSFLKRSKIEISKVLRVSCANVSARTLLVGRYCGPCGISTWPVKSKPNSRMIRMNRIGVMAMVCSIIDKRSPRPVCRAEHRATDLRGRTRRKRASLAL